MMKKLLLCSNNCQEDDNGDAHGDDDDKEDSDDADVIVESHQDHSLKSFYRQVETLENLNFNYDVIVKFVKQGKRNGMGQSFLVVLSIRVTKLCSRPWNDCQSLQSDPCWNARVSI